MKRSRVAKRYAQALFESALETKQLEPVEADLELLGKGYRESGDFQHIIDSPVISNQVKQQVFSKIYEKHLRPLTLRFISLLIAKNREALLPQVVSDFQYLLDEHRGILRGEVFSVIPFSDIQFKKLKEQLDKMTGKNVVVTQHLDESLLGGFVVKIRDTVYDTSLSNKLNILRKNLIES